MYRSPSLSLVLSLSLYIYIYIYSSPNASHRRPPVCLGEPPPNPRSAAPGPSLTDSSFLESDVEEACVAPAVEKQVRIPRNSHSALKAGRVAVMMDADEEIIQNTSTKFK